MIELCCGRIGLRSRLNGHITRTLHVRKRKPARRGRTNVQPKKMQAEANTSKTTMPMRCAFIATEIAAIAAQDIKNRMVARFIPVALQ